MNEDLHLISRPCTSFIFCRRATLQATVFSANKGYIPYDPSDPYTSPNCLGVAEVAVAQLARKQLTLGWYRLFPATYYGVESDSE